MDILHRIHLHGALATEYGTEAFELYGTSIQDVMQGLCVNLGTKFKQTIREGKWHITKGQRSVTDDVPVEHDSFMAETEVGLFLPDEEIHIFPVIFGAGGRAGIGQIILGVVLIVVAVVLAFTVVGAALSPYLAGTGVSVIGLSIGIGLAGALSVLNGAIALASASPTISSPQEAQTGQKSSFIYNGPVNNTEQGVPVPLVFGVHMAGSTVISAGITTEQVSAT